MAAALIGAAGGIGGAAGSASAGTGLSDGCNFLNRPQYDGPYSFSPLVASAFRAGETITVRVGQPAPGPTPTSSELRFDDLVVDSGGFPAALTHTVPTDGFHSTNWQANQVATWNVSCGPPGIGSSDGGMLADTGPEASTIALLAGVMLVAARATKYSTTDTDRCCGAKVTGRTTVCPATSELLGFVEERSLRLLAPSACLEPVDRSTTLALAADRDAMSEFRVRYHSADGRRGRDRSAGGECRAAG